MLTSLPPDMRELFAEVIGEANPALLDALSNKTKPSPRDCEAVLEILTAEFCSCLQPNDEPTERGRLVDNALGAFLVRWQLVLPRISSLNITHTTVRLAS